jgi:hypothetical protein
MPAALRRQLAAVGRKSGIGILRSDKAEGPQSHHDHGLFSLPGKNILDFTFAAFKGI